MATHSSILAREIPWTEECEGIQSMELQSQSDMTWRLNNNNNKYLQAIELNSYSYSPLLAEYNKCSPDV